MKTKKLISIFLVLLCLPFLACSKDKNVEEVRKLLPNTVWKTDPDLWKGDCLKYFVAFGNNKLYTNHPNWASKNQAYLIMDYEVRERKNENGTITIEIYVKGDNFKNQEFMYFAWWMDAETYDGVNNAIIVQDPYGGYIFDMIPDKTRKASDYLKKTEWYQMVEDYVVKETD